MVGRINGRLKTQTKHSRVIHSWIVPVSSWLRLPQTFSPPSEIRYGNRGKKTGKKGKDLTTWRTFLEKSFSWTPHSSVFVDFPRCLSTLLLQRGLFFGSLLNASLRTNGGFKRREGVWWDESDNPSKQSDRMEKQATLKEKVNRLNKKQPLSTLSCELPFL